MKPFAKVRGIGAPLMRINVDTDAIIPSREMKQVSKSGLADGLFAGWRYLEAGSRKPDPRFVLNREPYDRACVLVSGRNFGCGSSREHAVWALGEWGIRVIIAPSFGSIFESNCLRNGLLPVRLPPDAVDSIAAAITEDPLEHLLTVDLEKREVVMSGRTWAFEIPDREREMLLRGLSPIGITLEREDLISRFEAEDRSRRPWAHGR